MRCCPGDDMVIFFKSDDDDDDDTEVALVRPVQAVGQPFTTGKEPKEKPLSTIEKMTKTFSDSTIRCFFSTIIVSFVLGGVILCYLYCPWALFGILFLSAYMVSYDNYWNIPLWASILLIIMFGITVMHRDITFVYRNVN